MAKKSKPLHKWMRNRGWEGGSKMFLNDDFVLELFATGQVFLTTRSLPNPDDSPDRISLGNVAESGKTLKIRQIEAINLFRQFADYLYCTASNVM